MWAVARSSRSLQRLRLMQPVTSSAVASFATKKALKPLGIDRMAVIGGGNMAEAIVTSLVSEKLIASGKIVISDPNPGVLILPMCVCGGRD